MGVRRPEDHQLWKLRDPIARLERGLVAAGLANESDFETLYQSVEAELNEAWARAEQDPRPEADSYLAYSYESH